jgi:hypothetical protein
MATKATKSVQIRLDRGGGALIRADIFVFADPTSNSPNLVAALQFKNFLLDPETQTISLLPGTYAAKSFMTLREGINSDFDYTVTAANVAVAALAGDAKKLSATDGQPDPLTHTRFFTA